MAIGGISFRGGEDFHPWLSCSCLTGLWGQRATGVRNTTLERPT